MVRPWLLLFVVTSLFAQSQTEELEALKARLSALEAKSKTHNSKGSLELKSTETVLSVGGRVRLDMVYNDPATGESGGGSNDYLFTPKSISTDPDNNGALGMTAKESRLWIKTRHPTEYGMLLSLIETDFYGSSGDERTSNSHNIRLRHAYVSVGSLTVGQTNSTFMGSGVPDTIKAPVDDIVIRQPQIRWSFPLDSGNVQLAVEQPETLINDGGKPVAVNNDKVPDVVAKYVRYGRWGELSLAALGRQIRIGEAYKDRNISETKTGGALHLSGRFRIGVGDTLRFGLSGGNALGRYIAGGTGIYTCGSIEADNTIHLHPIYGGHLAYQHWWRKNLRSNLAYGFVSVENHPDVAAGSDKGSRSTHLNLRWIPIPSGELGVEYIDAVRELESGERFYLQRIHFIASYEF